MVLEFNFADVRVTEFGIGRDSANGRSFVVVPVDDGVQSALREMGKDTLEAMGKLSLTATKYEPSEKHASMEFLYLPFGSALVHQLKELHEAENLDSNAKALDEPKDLFCYFAKFTDGQGRHLTALRRASHFKGVLKKRLIRIVTDSLKMIDENVFRLDNDFDLLIDANRVHILRPSGFEFAGQLQEAILKAVPQNIAAIKKDLNFVEFDRIEQYASTRPRAARYIASIRGQKETKNIDREALKKQCKKTGVKVKDSNGKVSVAKGHELSFLEVLDRRLYEVELVKDKPEKFRAASRRPIKN